MATPMQSPAYGLALVQRGVERLLTRQEELRAGMQAMRVNQQELQRECRELRALIELRLGGPQS